MLKQRLSLAHCSCLDPSSEKKSSSKFIFPKILVLTYFRAVALKSHISIGVVGDVIEVVVVGGIMLGISVGPQKSCTQEQFSHPSKSST